MPCVCVRVRVCVLSTPPRSVGRSVGRSSLACADGVVVGLVVGLVHGRRHSNARSEKTMVRPRARCRLDEKRARTDRRPHDRADARARAATDPITDRSIARSRYPTWVTRTRAAGARGTWFARGGGDARGGVTRDEEDTWEKIGPMTSSTTTSSSRRVASSRVAMAMAMRDGAERSIARSLMVMMTVTADDDDGGWTRAHRRSV